jgi:lauroyl-KDO2-lipid IV(A) myristoyltransferase
MTLTAGAELLRWLRSENPRIPVKSQSNTVSERLPKRLLAPRYWFTWLGVAVFWFITQLPQSVRHKLGVFAGTIVWRRNKKRRDIVNINLTLCFPEWMQAERNALNKRHFQVMGRSLLDMGLIWFASDKRLKQSIDMEGWEHIESAKAAGKNIIVHVAHSVGLEFGAMSIGSHNPGIGLYKKSRNDVVDWWVARGRRRFGNRVFERDDGVMAFARVIKNGELLYALTDEDHGIKASVFAPFFNQSKASLPMTGRLAKITQASVFPVMTYYSEKNHRYLTKVFPALPNFPVGDKLEDTTRLNESLEQMIRLAPEEYMWTLRIFLTRPDGKRIYHY